MSYKHLRIIEREKMLFCIAAKYSITETAKYIGRDKSTISRELKRNAKIYKPKRTIEKGVKVADHIKNLKIVKSLNL